MPETEFTDVTRTIVRDGRVVAEIRAQQVLNFRRRARTILLDVQYTEYDAAGNAVTTGSAERATCYTERKDAELAGSIRLRSDSQQVSLQAQTLRWEDGRRRLVTTPEAVVEILRDDGFPGDRQRPGGGRAAQDDPLHRAGQRYSGHRLRGGGVTRAGGTEYPCRAPVWLLLATYLPVVLLSSNVRGA